MSDAPDDRHDIEYEPGEPPLAPDDTQPRVPVALEAGPPYMSEPPVDPDADTADRPRPRRVAERVAEPNRALLYFTVMLGSVCLCATLVALAGFAGYRDGLATNDARVTQTLATGIAQQYATGVADFESGYAELAAARFGWIVETVQAPPEYARDSQARLDLARTVAAYTATKSPTLSPTPSPTVPATATPTPAPTGAATATLSPLQDPDYLYQQAQTALGVNRYEEAIQWLDALRALDPTFRAEEVKAALVQALSTQGKIYLRGQNADGEDQLMRGVTLVYRAADLGTIENTLLGEAIFAEDFINARSYVNGGYYAQALPILEDLCNRNCGWGYPSINPVTVRDLLQQAQAGASDGS